MPTGYYIGFQKGNTINLGKKYSQDRKDKIGLANSGIKLSKECLNCKKLIELRPCEKHIKFCSTKCYAKHCRGEKHHAWNGGHYESLRHQLKLSPKYRKWRLDIFRRDNFTCVLCHRDKEVRSKLQADHYPVSYAEIKERYKLNSFEKAIKCRLLFNIKNGRTLCEDCHKKTPTYGGKNMKKFRDRTKLSDRGA